LIAYAKIDLFDKLVASAAPDDPAFEDVLKGYFPTELGKYESSMMRHRLRREIIATQMADEIVNRCGPVFIDRVGDIARVETATIASAFETARRVFDLDAFAARVNALDNVAPANVQTTMHHEIARMLLRLTIYLSRHAGFGEEGAPQITAVVDRYQAAVAAQRTTLWTYLGEAERARAVKRRAALIEEGAPAELAQDAALLRPLAAALDIADLARKNGWEIGPASHLYRAIGLQCGLDSLREAALSLTLREHWDRLVIRRAVEDLYEDQRRLAEAASLVIGPPPKMAGAEWAENAARNWIGSLGPAAQRARAVFAELDAQGPWSFAKIMLAAAELNALANSLR